MWLCEQHRVYTNLDGTAYYPPRLYGRPPSYMRSIVDLKVIQCMTVHKCLVSFRQEGYKYKCPITPRVATVRHIYFLIALTA